MTAPDVEAPGEVGTESRAQGTTDAAIVAEQADERKEFETMRAQAAFARCTLFELASGGYLLCLAGVTRELPDLRAVGDLLRQIGGAA